MTDIFYHLAKYCLHAENEKGKIIFVPTKVKQLDIHSAGEDGEYLWFEMILDTGEKISTGYFKELPP